MISVLMPTYGRPELLNEAIYSFLIQTHGDSELIVSNDRHDQRLIFDHPRVRILNTTTRFTTLGDKRKDLVTHARGSLLAHWDDDDIYLADHLSTVHARLPLYRTGRIAKQHWCWFDTGKRLNRLIRARYQHTMLMEKSLYDEIEGHPRITQNEDHHMILRLLRSGQLAGPPVTGIQRPTFILRDATGRFHVSDVWNGDGYDAERYARIAGEVDALGVTGDIRLEPGWRSDHAARAQESWEAVQ